MTLSSILSSDRIIIAIAGQTKRAVLERAMQGASLPISRVVNKEGAHIDVYWHP
jgi:6-phosphogluconolactonase/glucosamine-6-phosphate isomerase/deaminase